MEPTNTPGISQSRVKSVDSSLSDKETKKLQEKLKKIEVKPPSSPTSFLARNAALVPSQVARLKQIGAVRTGLEMGAPSGLATSSGSATGTNMEVTCGTQYPINGTNGMDSGDIFFQQDGATCHTAGETMQLLQTKFHGRVISRRGDVNWPPRSCDLTPLDFLWGFLE